MRVRALFTFVLPVGLATAAFGGVAAAGDLSKKDYLEEANAICAAVNEEISAAFEEIFAAESAEDVDEALFEQLVLETLVPAVRQGLDDIEALDGPSKVEKKVGKALDQYRDAIDELEEDPSLLFDEENDPFEKANKTARKAGLDECSEDEGEEE